MILPDIPFVRAIISIRVSLKTCSICATAQRKGDTDYKMQLSGVRTSLLSMRSSVKLGQRCAEKDLFADYVNIDFGPGCKRCHTQRLFRFTQKRAIKELESRTFISLHLDTQIPQSRNPRVRRLLTANPVSVAGPVSSSA